MVKTDSNNNATNTIEQDNGSDKLLKDNNEVVKISDDIIKTTKKPNNNNNNGTNTSSIDNIYIDPSLQNNNDNDNHSIPTFPQVPHHAPPEDSSELTSPWWSAEQADTPDNSDNNDNNSMDNNNNSSSMDNNNDNNNNNHSHNIHNGNNNNNEHENQLQNEELSHFLVSFSRQATERKNGDMVWREDCFIWTKEPKQQKESNLVDEIKDTAITYSQQQQPSLSPFPTNKSVPDYQHHHNNNNTKKTFPLNSQCTMVCLFRESQQRKLKKLKEANMSNTWNPFYGNWLVVTKTRTAFTEHIAGNDITKKNSPDYYTVELGEKFGHIGEDVTKFFAKTFTPMQELGRRYVESWNDGTQSRFFNKFYESAKRGDAFLLVRDSARRMIENMMNTEEKKKEDDDHKR
ncbi:unnamed protein product [Cunninghamella blakesleeana]